MKITYISASEWLYPDVREYATQGDRFTIHGPRGGYAAIQAMAEGVTKGARITVEAALGLDGLECYQMIDVLCSYNTGEYMYPFALPQGTDTSAWTTRLTPFRAYDCLQPFSRGGDIARAETVALYFCFPLDAEMEPGVYGGEVTIKIGGEKSSSPCEVVVHKAVAPPETNLMISNWINAKNIEKYYDAPYLGDKWFEQFGRLAALMRRARSTHIGIPLNSVGITEKDGKYAFDFTIAEKLIRFSLKMGFQVLALGHLCWKDYNKNDIYYLFHAREKPVPADSPEGYRFLSQFLPAWTAFLKEHGFYDKAVQQVGDEPNSQMCDNYRIICGVVRKFMPGMKLMDAISDLSNRGASDYWVVLNCEYQENREIYEEFRATGDIIWQYTACGPGGKWLNRMIDIELLRPRLLHWGNYRFKLEGYLHWGFNFWQPDQPDIYEYSNSVINDGTTLLPPGDTHICYPGDKRGPWMSIRAEQMRMGAEDCELLYWIAQRDRALADDLCAGAFTSFNDYVADPAAFERNYVRLLEAADGLYL